ncbi:Hypothetical protein A7982_02541 [Minicystis rosea]|nr:Hypothetical protein A7982_02541 [Minicystis rosea]
MPAQYALESARRVIEEPFFSAVAPVRLEPRRSASDVTAVPLTS